MSQFPGGTPVASLNGTETVEVGPGSSGANTGPQNLTATVRQIADLASLSSDNIVVTTLSTVGAGTITAAGIAGGITSRTGAQSGTGFTDTTATAALIIAALPAGAPVGTSFLWKYDNTTNAAATLAGGSGVTLSGNVIVPLLTWAEYLVTYSATGAVTVVYVDGGQLSPWPAAQFATDAAQAATLTMAGISGAQVCNITLTGTTPGTVVVPTATQFFAGTPNARIGMSYMLNIRNLAASTATLGGLSSITITGTATIQTNATRTFVVTITGATAVTLQSMGTSWFAA